MKTWLKTSFCFKSFIILTSLVSVGTPEDICESCVPVSQCPFFASMGSKEQLSWMQKYPCNNHPDDYGIPPGSKNKDSSKDKGDSVCCPNQVWGVDKENHLNRLTNRYGNSQDTPESYNNQIQPPYAFNNGIKNDNINNNDGYPNNQQWKNQNNSPLGPKRWSTTEKNTNWNERPDKSQWNIGNPNYYQSNDNYWRNNVNNRPNNQGSQRSPYFYNWRNFINNDRTGNRNNDNRVPSQPDNSNNKGSGIPNSLNNSFLPNSQQPGNSCAKTSQCDHLTRFPPNPQTGCCGREASDDDRINDAPNFSKHFSPTFNDFWSRATKYPNYDWSYSMFKEEVNGTDGSTQNKTTHITFNSTLPSGSFSSTNGTIDDDVTVEVEYRIAGGKETELTQYPWTVLLIATFASGTQTTSVSCGGTLISARYVLTAAHCLYDDKATLKNVKVFLAEYDKNTFPTDCKTTSRGRKCVENLALFAANVHLSPEFEESRLQNDIALIELQSDVPYTDYIRPICLPSINVDDPEHARLTLTAAGWGRNGPYQTDVKQSTTIHLVPQYDCRRFYPDLTPRHLCAAGYTGEDTCKGDSGGPLMVKYRGKYFVVGVVSGKRTDVKCGSAVPSLYTNVYHYLNWIRDTIANQRI